MQLSWDTVQSLAVQTGDDLLFDLLDAWEDAECGDSYYLSVSCWFRIENSEEVWELRIDTGEKLPPFTRGGPSCDEDDVFLN